MDVRKQFFFQDLFYSCFFFVNRCVFLPDNGAFFVNYIITSAFIGAAIDLLRLADLVFYIYIILTAKSTAERRVIRDVRIILG